MRLYILKKLGAMSLTVLCIFFLAIAANNAQAEDIVIIDNYNDGNTGANTFGFWTGWGKGNSGSFDVREVNGVKQFTYNLPTPADYGWYASNIYGNLYFLDFSDYDYLSFSVKGDRGGEQFHVQLQYNNPINGGPGPLDELTAFEITPGTGVGTTRFRTKISSSSVSIPQKRQPRGKWTEYVRKSRKPSSSFPWSSITTRPSGSGGETPCGPASTWSTKTATSATGGTAS